MMTFLQIVGGIVVAIVLIIAAIYAFLRFKFGRMLQAAELTSEPLQIHLNEDFAPDWRDQGDAAEYLRELKSLGFETGKAYFIVEMEGVCIQSLFKPPYVASICTHPAAGDWVDVSFVAATGEKEIDVTNAPMGETINSRPETQKIYLKAARAPQLFETLREVVGDAEGKLINDSNYRDFFEDAYRKDMVWRCSRGGLTFAEFAATAAAGEEKYSEQQIREAYVETKLEELHVWHEAALERIVELDEAALESLGEKADCLFLLPKNGNVEAYIHYIEGIGVIDSKQADALVRTFAGQSDLPMVAKRIFDGLSAELRPKKVRDIDFPVHGELYEAH